ncbi:hypothetical protein N177_3976 [Lutibaculum baratangense AMV1]|uniref:Uncharacterized protein n=1 Tax=Lutibaculum baratangense AMV1 TaxID=631454 RepID=V4RBR1_9HYPH|nr:hypothetical protein N177_3976 [Lutibaculum baratangense AMV1]
MPAIAGGEGRRTKPCAGADVRKVPHHRPGEPMFFFFSNRLGCLGSIAVSAVITLALLAFFGVI